MPPTLPDDMLEQIFLRLPPDEPACLVRASLARKFWLRHISGLPFRGRYRDHHGALPILGFLRSKCWDYPLENGPSAPPPFISTTGFRARIPGDGWGDRDYIAWDCHHGRVLLGQTDRFPGQNNPPRRIAVWDPMTGRRWEMQEPDVELPTQRFNGGENAAVLCAVSGCNHLACHDGPFRVVFISLHWVAADDCVAQARTVSSAGVAEWSDPCPGISVGHDGSIEPRQPVLVNDAVHFLLWHGAGILKYDLSSNSLSLIDVPNVGAMKDKNLGFARSVLMATKDKNLGFAHLNESTLFIWSRDVGFAAWTQRRVIDLKNILPMRRGSYRLIGSVEGRDTFFVAANSVIYKINLKSLHPPKRKSKNKILNAGYMDYLIPYTSFCSSKRRVRPCDNGALGGHSHQQE